LTGATIIWGGRDEVAPRSTSAGPPAVVERKRLMERFTTASLPHRLNVVVFA
jgi:hypothetical protein